ncbi:Vitamin B12 ABC transporter, substrate-binding protein BtuF [hydrothermal vent metagenome]|uniref:Vitamin B12 ABC transporter, substrate-binding protein BtuF n=1 Tax=hydrothermal vent metagenome TaxID=652676 RepID=A0A3B0YPY9_9ZZZZ
MHATHLLLITLFICLPTRAAGEIRVHDDTDSVVTLKAPAQRIISLAPHVTELLFAAGAGDKVVGVVNYSNFPPAAAQLPIVGGYESLNLEAILALKPDLLVAWKSGNFQMHVERLADLGIPVFYSEPRQLEDIATNLERLGQLAGTEHEATAAAKQFRQRLGDLSQRYADQTPLRTFYQIWHQPLMTINGEHLISQVITLCGGHNIFSDLSALAPSVDREAVLRADPEVIIASGMAKQQPQWLDDWKQWSQLTATRLNQLYFIEPDLIQRHTPRILDGADIMCRQLAEARARH